jgi:hypothetical protein
MWSCDWVVDRTMTSPFFSSAVKPSAIFPATPSYTVTIAGTDTSLSGVRERTRLRPADLFQLFFGTAIRQSLRDQRLRAQHVN